MLFTVALTAWLYVFSFEQVEKLSRIDNQAAKDFVRHHRMLLWEGGFLIFCLIAGGALIFYFLYRDMRQSSKIRDFFLTFTHELKTPIASLRIQAESLKEDLAGSQDVIILNRLISDANRLALQLENSIAAAEAQMPQLYSEEVDLQDLLRNSQYYWPELKFRLPEGLNAKLNCDPKAIDIIFRNLIQNSVTHGRASEVSISASRIKDSDLIRVEISDNGRGFEGNRKKLGAFLERHFSGSGNGLGLYIVGKLIQGLKGSICFPESHTGFRVELEIPGVLYA